MIALIVIGQKSQQHVVNNIRKDYRMLLDKNQIADFELIKSHIKIRLAQTGYFDNSKCIIKDVNNMTGISYVPYINMGFDGDKNLVTAAITPRLANYWNKTTDDLIELGKSNVIAEHNFRSMRLIDIAAKSYQMTADEFLKDLVDIVPDYSEHGYTSQYVITTNECQLGAINALLFPEEIQNLIGEKDYAIIPSSIHDTIVMPIDQGMKFDTNIIVQVNNSEDSGVQPCDILSDKIYCYVNGKFGILEPVL